MKLACDTSTPLGLSTASQVGVLPPPVSLQQLPVIPTEDLPDVSRQVTPPHSQEKVGTPEARSARPPENKSPPDQAEQPKQYLAAVGLPTIPRKLANRIWELDFIEMDELLPSNKAIQALEGAGSQETGASTHPGLSPSQSRRTMDVMAWVRCYNLYTAVMAQRRPELIGPMAAHLHTVLTIHNAGGLAWFQYDWRTRRESCATGPAEWGRRDPFNLVSCCSGSRVLDDPFSPLPLTMAPVSPREVGTREMEVAKPRQIPHAPNASRKKGGLCRLFNKAPGGLPLWRPVHLPSSLLVMP